MTHLVIGYGNMLRGDDALGPRVAEAAAAWELPDVRALAVHQLTPELAPLLAAAASVIFVDARAAQSHAEDEAVVVTPVAPPPAAGQRNLGHTGAPHELLALTAAVYGTCPPAWLLTVPAEQFDFGAPLSARAERGCAAALRELRQRLEELRATSDD